LDNCRYETFSGAVYREFDSPPQELSYGSAPLGMAELLELARETASKRPNACVLVRDCREIEILKPWPGEQKSFLPVPTSAGALVVPYRLVQRSALDNLDAVYSKSNRASVNIRALKKSAALHGIDIGHDTLTKLAVKTYSEESDLACAARLLKRNVRNTHTETSVEIVVSENALAARLGRADSSAGIIKLVVPVWGNVSTNLAAELKSRSRNKPTPATGEPAVCEGRFL